MAKTEIGKEIYNKIISFIQKYTGLSAPLAGDILWGIGLIFVIGLGLAIEPLINNIAQNDNVSMIVAILITIGGYGYLWYSSDPDGYKAILALISK